MMLGAYPPGWDDDRLRLRVDGGLNLDVIIRTVADVVGATFYGLRRVGRSDRHNRRMSQRHRRPGRHPNHHVSAYPLASFGASKTRPTRPSGPHRELRSCPSMAAGMPHRIMF